MADGYQPSGAVCFVGIAMGGAADNSLVIVAAVGRWVECIADGRFEVVDDSLNVVMEVLMMGVVGCNCCLVVEGSFVCSVGLVCLMLQTCCPVVCTYRLSALARVGIQTLCRVRLVDCFRIRIAAVSTVLEAVLDERVVNIVVA